MEMGIFFLSHDGCQESDNEDKKKGEDGGEKEEQTHCP